MQSKPLPDRRVEHLRRLQMVGTRLKHVGAPRLRPTPREVAHTLGLELDLGDAILRHPGQPERAARPHPESETRGTEGVI